MNMVDQPLISATPLKIGLIESPPYIYKNTLGDITGYEYDIIKQVVSENNLTVEYDYIEEKGRKYTYNQMIDLLSNGQYDILIGNISQTYDRSKVILYGTPVAMDIGSFYYIPSRSTENSNNMIGTTEIGTTILKVIVAIVIVSSIISAIHYAIVPKQITYKESLWRVAATLFGEPGFILNPKLNEGIHSVSNKGLIIRIIIIFTSTLVGVFLTSYITGSIVSTSLKTLPFSNKNDLNGKTVAVRGGQSEESLLKYYKDTLGMNLVIVDETGDSTFKILSREIENNLSVDAFFMSSSKKLHKDEYNIYEKGNVVLEKGLISFAFNRNHVKLSQLVNISISNMREKKFIKELCDKYFSTIQDVCIQ
jgi:ABC-type amino acid transport substrate-binding protein